MTPPDRQKRPSARPSARAADKAQGGARENQAKANDAKPQGQRPEAAPSPTKRKHDKKQRVAARRSTAPDPASTAQAEAAERARENLAALKAQAASARMQAEGRSSVESTRPPVVQQPAAQKPAVQQPAVQKALVQKPVVPPREVAPAAQARPTSPAKPTRSSTARAQDSLPAQSRVPAEDRETDVDRQEQHYNEHEHEHEHDVFGDGGAAGLTAVVTASADGDASLDPPTRAINRLTKSSRDEKRQREEAVLLSQSRELLGTAYYFRQYGAHGIRSLSAEVDDFGLDPHFEERARPALEAMVKRYFRVDVDGAHHIPAQGRALMVANRAGALPWDGMVLRTAMRMTRPELSPVRWLAEDSIFHYPFLGVFMNRLGAVRACPENAERLLEQDRLVAVFPEGAQGSSKLFKERYRLQRFGRGGYVKLALKHGAPVIPTAIIGAEETNPLLGRARPLARALGASYLPITPTFPWLGPVGLLPAPVKWRIVVGEPIDLSSYGPEAAEDALVVQRLNDQIRSILQALVEQARSSRRSVLFG